MALASSTVGPMPCCSNSANEVTKHNEPKMRKPGMRTSRPATITTPHAANKKHSKKPALPAEAFTRCAQYQPT